MSKFIQKFLCLLCCFIVVFTSLSNVAFADDYEKYDDSDEDDQGGIASYYIIEGENFEKLWDFGLDDVDDLFDWIWNFKTYTVIKKYTDADGNVVYRGYFNTPNLQHLAKNYVTQLVDDGYTDLTYNVDETEWLVNVGADAPSVNVITKYGFNIPSYTYNGEYPKEIMTVAKIIPTSFWDAFWRAIAAFFGASFIKAPDADNFNTLTYLNHGYVDKEDFLVDFISEYYIPYFLARIANHDEDDSSGYVEDDDDLSYFNDIEDFIDQTVTEEENESAEDWIDENLEYYQEYTKIEYGWNNFANATPGGMTRFGVHYGNNGFAIYDDLNSYIGLTDDANDIEINVAHNETDTCEDGELPWENFNDFLLTQTEYIQAVQNWWDTSNKNDVANIIQSYILASPEHEYYNDMLTGDINDVIAFIDDKMSEADSTADFILKCMGNPAPIGDWYLQRGENDVSNPDGDDSSNLNLVDVHIAGTDYADMSSTAMYVTEIDYSNPSNQAEIDEWNNTPEDEREGDCPTPVYSNTINVMYQYATSTLYYKRGSDPDNFTGCGTINYDALVSFYSMCLCNWEFEREDWVKPNMDTLMRRFDECVKLTNKYDHFNEVCEMINDNDDYKPEGDSMIGIAYTQCLIHESEGQDEGSCISDEYGEETTITVGSLLGYSGLYQLTPDFDFDDYFDHDDDYAYAYWNQYPDIYEDRETLNTEVAHRIINYIKNATGPYYADVMSNIVALMLLNAADEGDDDPIDAINSDDVRVMPYDTASLTMDDAENYSVTDPRVDIYKEQIIGRFIADFTLDFSGIFKFFAPQKTIITIIGKITEFSVFMQQLCNFDLLDEYGLSPTTIWGQNGFAIFVMACLVLYFIFKTVKCVIDICRNSNMTGYTNKVIVGFLVLLIELGLIVAITANPSKTWNLIKKWETNIINLGEYGTLYSDPNLTYLFGDAADMEVTYYFPYLDAWSKYNTGYGILADEQLLDESDDLPELQEFINPKLGNNDIGHWSVLLMDAFEYHGHSESVYNSVLIVDADGNFHNVNGTRINNNAYRVVDHFLAPRIEFDESSDGETIDLDVEENENYNGEFQKGLADLFVKLLLALFICFLSMIKLLTFFWQWYMFYIFFFRAVLGKLAENKSWGKILLQTFTPTAAMIILGAFVGISLELGMRLEGFLGVVIILSLFILTLYMISWWYQMGHGDYFPGTLKWVYALSTLVANPQSKMAIEAQNEQGQAADDMIDKEYSDQSEEWRDIMKHGSLEQQKELLYNEDGTIKDEYKGKRFAAARGKYLNHINNKINKDGQIPEEIARHVKDMKQNDSDMYHKDLNAYDHKMGDNGKNIRSKSKKDIDIEYSEESEEWRNIATSGSTEEKYKLFCNEDGTFKAEYDDPKYDHIKRKIEMDFSSAANLDGEEVPDAIRERYKRKQDVAKEENEEKEEKGKTDNEADKQTDSDESDTQAQETGDE